MRHSAGDAPLQVVPAVRGDDGVRRHHPPIPPRAELVVEEAGGGGGGEEVARAAEGDEGGVHGAHGPPEVHSYSRAG